MSITTEQIWERLASSLRKFLQRRVNDPHLAEDLLQEVFVRIHRGIGTLTEQDRLAAWVFQIARNTLVDHLRRRQPATGLAEESVEADPVPTVSIEQELCGCLAGLIQVLPPTYREAVELAELGGVTQVEVAQRLGISVSGAKSRVQRGREQLKGLLLECCHLERNPHGRVTDWEPRGECPCGGPQNKCC